MSVPTLLYPRDEISDVVIGTTTRNLRTGPLGALVDVTLTFNGGVETQTLDFVTLPLVPRFSTWPGGDWNGSYQVVQSDVSLTHKVNLWRVQSDGMLLTSIYNGLDNLGTGLFIWDAGSLGNYNPVNITDRFLYRISVTRGAAKTQVFFTVRVNNPQMFISAPWDLSLPERLSGTAKKLGVRGAAVEATKISAVPSPRGVKAAVEPL